MSDGIKKSSYYSIPAASRGKSSKAFWAAAMRFLGESVFGKSTPEVTSTICPGFFLRCGMKKRMVPMEKSGIVVLTVSRRSSSAEFMTVMRDSGLYS